MHDRKTVDGEVVEKVMAEDVNPVFDAFDTDADEMLITGGPAAPKLAVV
jgi:hypothetical protein